MKSKVILFCVLLFCSKFVDSVPHSEELVRQRAFQPTNWPANKYAAGQYVDTNFAQTQNENVLKNSGLQLENNQNYFANQRRHDFDSQGYNKGLSSSLLGKERLQNYAPVEEERVNSYPIRHSYPSSAPQTGLDNQQFGFQNWRPQNQYTNAAPIPEVIPNNDRPLVTTVQEPYRGPVQYVKPQFIPPVNRRHHSVERFYPARDQLQYPIDNIGIPASVSTKYLQNTAPLSVVREAVPYNNYENGQGTASDNNAGIIASKQFFASESGSPYNGASDVISSEVLPEQSGNGYEVNQSSQSDSVITADITTFDNNSQDVPAANSYNIENRPSTLVPVDNKGEAASIIQKVLADKPLVRRYAHNYRPGYNWNNYAREISYNGASVGRTNTFELNSGNVNNNYGSEFVPNKPSPVNAYSKPTPSPAPSSTPTPASSPADATLNHGHKNAEAVPQYTTTPAPLENTNSENDFYHQLASGIHKYDLKNIASHPKIKDLLAVNNKPYVLIHANGSVEYFDKFDLDAKENSKYRLIHTKHTPLGKTQDGQGHKPLKPQPPTSVPISTTTPAPIVNDGISIPKPTSNEWNDDDSSYLNNPADDKTSHLSPLYRKHHDTDNYSTSPQTHVKLPAGDDDSKPSFSNVNQPQDDTHTKPLVSKESQSSDGDQPDTNDNNKPTASDDGWNYDNVNQPDDDSTSKPLVSKDGQSSNIDDSKPGFTSANQSDKGNNDNDDTKYLPDKVNQPDDDSTPKPASEASSNNDKLSQNEHHSDDNDDDSSLGPNVNQPEDNSTPKPVPSKNKQSVNGDDLVNQSDNDNSNNPQSPKENQPDNDDSSSADDNSNPKPLASKDYQSPNRDDSKPFSSDDNKSDDSNDNKPQKYSPKDNQPDDDDDDSSSTSNVNGKNDQTSPNNDGQLSNNRDDSNSLPLKVNQSDDDSNANNADENSPDDDQEPKSTTPDSSISDNNPTSTTPSPVASDQKTSSTLQGESTPSSSVKSTTASPDVTTPHADTTSEDEITTISPTATDNVSNAPAVTTTRPTKTHPRFHIGTPASNKKDNPQDDSTTSSTDADKTQTSTQDSQSSSASQNDNTDETKTKDEIITISPIELATDNVSDAPVVTTARPTKTHHRLHIGTTASNKKDNPQDDATTSSTDTDNKQASTQDSQSSSASQNDNTGDSKTKDEIITISPIELATDNVSDAPAVTTTRPTKTHHRFHIGTTKPNRKDNAQDDSTASATDTDKQQTSTQDSQSSSASQSDNTSDTNKNDIQKNNESTVSQTKENDKTAMYNSLTNTDVPAESDDYSPVTPSIRIDVNTGDDVNTTPGDNSLESEQSETDVKITVSAIDDPEDDIIAITIEVSESAGDADSDDKSVVIKVNTNDSDSADSKTSNANDCEKNQTNKNENTNQNLEIDMANIEGEPTMWIRTTNQDFVEKLASKNDTQFDVIYFFNMNPQPTIEREKVTTIHCNGTVVIENTETSYANKNDKTPKIVKTTTVLQIEDYEP